MREGCCTIYWKVSLLKILMSDIGRMAARGFHESAPRQYHSFISVVTCIADIFCKDLYIIIHINNTKAFSCFIPIREHCSSPLPVQTNVRSPRSETDNHKLPVLNEGVILSVLGLHYDVSKHSFWNQLYLAWGNLYIRISAMFYSIKQTHIIMLDCRIVNQISVHCACVVVHCACACVM